MLVTTVLATPILWMHTGVAAAGGQDTYPIVRPDQATPGGGGGAGGGGGGGGGGGAVGSGAVEPLSSPRSGGFAGLPFTGFELLALLVAALVLLAAGAAALAWRRRRLA